MCRLSSKLQENGIFIGKEGKKNLFTFDCAKNGRERRGQARWHVWEDTDDVEVLILGEGKNYYTLMSVKNCKSKLIENDWNPTVTLGGMAELTHQSRKVLIWCTHQFPHILERSFRPHKWPLLIRESHLLRLYLQLDIKSLFAKSYPLNEMLKVDWEFSFIRSHHILNDSFIYYLLSTYYVSSTVLRAGVHGEQNRLSPVPMELIFWLGEAHNKHK